MPFVERLIVENFYNYKDKTDYEFKRGLNIIVADNNGGKSKLYNAFSWILSDKVFDSDDREYYDVRNSDKKGLFKIISDKAKFEVSIGDKIVTSVELIFTNDFNISHVNTYRIVKKITAILRNDTNVYDVRNWDIHLERPDYFIEDTIDSKPIDEDRIKGMLYPEALKHYFLFQGEEVDRLVSNELTNAIKEIQGIWMYDYLEYFFDDIVSKAESDLQKQLKKHSRNKKESDRLNNEIDNLKSMIEVRTKELRSKIEAKESLLEKKTLTDSEFLDLRKQNETTRKLQECEMKINSYKEKISIFEKNYNEHFFSSKWLLLGFDKTENDFFDLRKQYKDHINSEKTYEHIFSTPLPKGSPDPVSLKEMLSDKKCYVCNRSIEPGSEPYQHIKNLLEKNNNITEIINRIDPIDDFFDELYKSFNDFPTVEQIQKEKEKLKKEYTNLKESLNKYSLSESNLQRQLKYESDEFEKKWKDHNDLEHLISKVNKEIGELEHNISNANETLKNKEIELRRYATTYDKNFDKKLSFLVDLRDAFIRTVDRKYQNMVKELQKNINRIYNSLTINSETNPGNIVIRVSGNKKFISELQNSQGGILTGQGTAFQRMKQLSIIIGITKMKSNNEYPLIADAPVSEMGEILTQNFFYNVPKHFNQSIILVKDLYKKNDDGISEINDFGRNIIDNSSLNPKVYLNTAIGKDQHERNTEVRLISSGK